MKSSGLYWSGQIPSPILPDPFTEHVEQDLSEAEVASLHHALAQPLRYEQAAVGPV